MASEIKPWKTLTSEYVIRRPWLTARRDAVELPDGRRIDEYYVLEYPVWVNVIARTPDGLYVMVEQYRHGPAEISMEICAGVAEDGETPLQAARRELLEETGYGGGTWTELCVLSPSGSFSNKAYCFLADGVVPAGPRHLDPGEDIAVHLLTAHELYALLQSGGIHQALMAAPLWKHFAGYAAR